MTVPPKYERSTATSASVYVGRHSHHRVPYREAPASGTTTISRVATRDSHRDSRQDSIRRHWAHCPQWPGSPLAPNHAPIHFVVDIEAHIR